MSGLVEPLTSGGRYWTDRQDDTLRSGSGTLPITWCAASPPLCRQDVLYVCARHVQRLELGPIIGEPQFSGSDLMAGGATKLLEPTGLAFLVPPPLGFFPLLNYF